MKALVLSRSVFVASAALALASCGGSQPLISAPSLGAQSPVDAARTKSANFRVVYSFGAAAHDGRYPAGPLIAARGKLYGTTSAGGDSGYGTVFSITQRGVEKILHSFGSGSKGIHPSNALIDVHGALYGTTQEGGSQTCYFSTGSSFRCGTVFSIAPRGKERVLHSFAGGNDGSYPVTSLIDVDGVFYGTTHYGGMYCRCGTVFSITSGGVESVLYSFSSESSSSDGRNPSAGLIDVGGTLYGTTTDGGSGCTYYGCAGTVFSITTGGAEKVLHSFGEGTDGVEPTAALVDVNGMLYGTTEWTRGCNVFGNCGTVFSITPDGTENVLHRFDGGTDGGAPLVSLIGVNGTLYGTTYGGGGGNCDSGCGTVFSITPGGSEKVLHRFSYGAHGYYPDSALLYVNGTLYGTTSSGGKFGDGTVFALTL